jgi:hypothetical protein
VNVHPFIEAEKHAGHSVKRACDLLKVSRAAFYARRTGKPCERRRRDAELTSMPAPAAPTALRAFTPRSGRWARYAADAGLPG